MKKTLLINIFLVFFRILSNKEVSAQTTLSPGDLVIVEFQTVNPDDDFSFIPLVDLSTGTIIKFTDCGWKTNNTFRDGEAVFKWTASTSVAKGTVINCSVNTITSNIGTFASAHPIDGITTNGPGFSQAGEQLIAYQTLGTNLYAVYAKHVTPINTVGTWDSDATSNTTSAMPTSNSIVKNGDNLVFTGSVTGDKTVILAAVNNPANWTATDGTAVTYTGTISFGALPIELTLFEGNQKEGRNLLTWQTASESQNNGFDIERSIDGIRFQKIGFVTGKGTTTARQDYNFNDEAQAGTTYYRLKQLDFDGRFEYSKVIAITQKGENSVSVFPNPSKGTFSITGIENLEDETFMLTNSVGQTLNLQVSDNGQFDISGLPSGLYYLRVASNGQVMKLIKE